jgi:hypothetical protein
MGFPNPSQVGKLLLMSLVVRMSLWSERDAVKVVIAFAVLFVDVRERLFVHKTPDVVRH